MEAVRAVVRPYCVPGYNFATCSTRSPRQNPALTCPETARLRHRVGQYRIPGGGLAFCRCQSPPRTVRIHQISNNGRVAHVDAWWDLGPNAFTDTFVAVHGKSGWLVDNEYCQGQPNTGVYLPAGQRPCH